MLISDYMLKEFESKWSPWTQKKTESSLEIHALISTSDTERQAKQLLLDVA